METQREEKYQATQRVDILRDHVEMDSAKKAAWAKLLTSVASAEGSEQALMQPLVEFFVEFTKSSGSITHDFRRHEEDEAKHFEQITSYVWETFAHRKQHRSLSDRVVYDGAFVHLKNFARRRPLPFLLSLYFYEVFSAQFYSSLRKLAKEDQLPVLSALISSIEKDELRHHAGLKSTLMQMSALGVRPDWIDTLATRFMIGLVCADIDLRPWAIYNRKVRKNTSLIGLDLSSFRKNVLHARGMALKELDKMRSGGAPRVV